MTYSDVKIENIIHCTSSITCGRSVIGYKFCIRHILEKDEYIINNNYFQINKKLINNLFEKHEYIIKHYGYYFIFKINKNEDYLIIYPPEAFKKFIDYYDRGKTLSILSVNEYIIKNIIE